MHSNFGVDYVITYRFADTSTYLSEFSLKLYADLLCR